MRQLIYLAALFTAPFRSHRSLPFRFHYVYRYYLLAWPWGDGLETSWMVCDHLHLFNPLQTHKPNNRLSFWLLLSTCLTRLISFFAVVFVSRSPPLIITTASWRLVGDSATVTQHFKTDENQKKNKLKQENKQPSSGLVSLSCTVTAMARH